MSSTEERVTEVSSKSSLATNPVISVIIITYNHENYLPESIESITSQQTDFHFEIIITDDCSSDRTRQIAIDYQKKYPQLIRVLYGEKNIGPGSNFQRALKRSRGQYIATCEGDDQWDDATKLQKQVTYLLNHNDIVVTYHDALSINDRGEKIADTQLESKRGKHDFTAFQLQAGMYLPTLTICFRNVLTELPYEFFRVVNQDTFLLSMLGAHGGAKYIEDIRPAKYRVHEGGVWSTLNRQEKDIRQITTAYWLSSYHKRIGNPHISTIYTSFAETKLLGQLHIEKLDLMKIVIKWMFKDLYKRYRLIRYGF